MLTRTVRALAVLLLVLLDHMMAPKLCAELFELSEQLAEPACRPVSGACRH
ncbi:hypothetical protein QYN14_21690 [Rhodococcus ruber]|uniref:hypothetical protein n=1 Tax=Rhodococcus ruber TaxID=1830 RepID=UPI00265B4DB9|nr:hypothetical protein [Rhodococcus ruber]WKK11287.1 hypothetical protein QYN14_21690 [Rhodococcus ruber]